MPVLARIEVTDRAVIPLENGIQVKGMDPGFHQVTIRAGMTEIGPDYHPANAEPVSWKPPVRRSMHVLQ
jgi:hypothetical protein